MIQKQKLWEIPSEVMIITDFGFCIIILYGTMPFVENLNLFDSELLTKGYLVIFFTCLGISAIIKGRNIYVRVRDWLDTRNVQTEGVL